jgi:hypothetical protein
MKRLSLIVVLLVFSSLVFTQTMQGQQAPAPAPKAAETKGAAAKKPAGKSKEWKIKNAMSAAPAAISKNATILDHPANPNAEAAPLRKGTNDWTCFSDDPTTPANDPMCLDKPSMEWAKAWMSKGEPKLTSAGIGYMLQGGGTASNTDPFAKKPAAGEKWMKEAPHVMLFLPGKIDAKVYGTDPHSGGPWVMWAGTPYEHIMAPVK